MSSNLLDKQFQAMLQKSPNKGGWTYVVMPDSVDIEIAERALYAKPYKG